MTWSIVTHDPATGAFAVAVATGAFAVGASCPFVRAGVGAVSTQSMTNRYLGPAILDGLSRGLDPARRSRAGSPATEEAACARSTRWTGTAAPRPGRAGTAWNGAAAWRAPRLQVGASASPATCSPARRCRGDPGRLPGVRGQAGRGHGGNARGSGDPAAGAADAGDAGGAGSRRRPPWPAVGGDAPGHHRGLPRPRPARGRPSRPAGRDWAACWAYGGSRPNRGWGWRRAGPTRPASPIWTPSRPAGAPVAWTCASAGDSGHNQAEKDTRKRRGARECEPPDRPGRAGLRLACA